MYIWISWTEWNGKITNNIFSSNFHFTLLLLLLLEEVFHALSLSLRSYSNGKLQRTADEKKTPIFFGVHYYSWQLMCEGGIFFYSILSLCRQSRFQFDMCNKLRKYRSKNAHTICMRQSISMDGFFLSLLLSIFHCWIFFLLFFALALNELDKVEWK